MVATQDRTGFVVSASLTKVGQGSWVCQIWHLSMLLLLLGACAPLATGDKGGESQGGRGNLPTPAGAAVLKPVHAPKSLAVYYGWPSAVAEGGDSAPSPVEVFARFAVVVLGAGLEEPAHPDYSRSVALIAALKARGVEIYGYLDMGLTTQPRPLTTAEWDQRIALWQGMGVTGIFWDDVGYEFAGGLDYVAYRRRQIELIELTRGSGLTVFLNVWNPDDLFRATHEGQVGLPVVMLRATDMVLAESWFISAGRFVDPAEWQRKAEKLVSYRQERPYRLACVATGPDLTAGELSSAFEAAYWAAVMYECDFFQYTDPQYGARSAAAHNRLTALPSDRVADEDHFLGQVRLTRSGPIYEFTRETERGMIVAGSDGVREGYGVFRRRESLP